MSGANGIPNTPDSQTFAAARAFLRGGRFAHAVLIEGAADACGRLAKELAQAALCVGEDRPCGVCRHCRKVVKGIHPDLLCFSGEGGARSFHVDRVREIRSRAQIRPNEGACTVLLLRDVQQMSVQAQNALLKVLEEPPEHARFILTCDNRAALLETILSRVVLLPAGPGELPQSGQSEQARELLERLRGNRELDALALLWPYERDRAGFAGLLDRIGECARAIALENSAAGAWISQLQLARILAIIDEMSLAADANANGPLLCTVLCAELKAALDEA